MALTDNLKYLFGNATKSPFGQQPPKKTGGNVTMPNINYSQGDALTNALISGNLQTMPQTKTTTPSMAGPVAPKPVKPVQPVAPSPQTTPQQTGTTQVQNMYGADFSNLPAAPLPSQQGAASGAGQQDMQQQMESQPSGSGTFKTQPVPQVSNEVQKAYDTAMKAYQQSLQISPEEMSTQEDLDKLIEATKKGYTAIEGQPIALGFITGQLQSLEDRARNLAEPLENKLARLQAQRVASLEASKFGLEQAQNKLIAEQQKVEEAKKAAQGKIMEFGGNLVQVLPDGTVQVIAEGPKEMAKPVTLSSGQILVDPNTGNIIATGQESQQDMLQLQKLQLDIQKAQQELSGSGQSLSPSQIQDAVSKGYTSQADIKLYAQMAAGGVNPPKKLTGEQMKLQSSVESALKDLTYISENVDKRWLPGWAGNKQYKAAEDNIADVMTRLRSGAAITAEEEKLYKGLLPKATDSDETAISKLQRLQEVLNGFLGGAQVSTQQNPFLQPGFNDPLGFSQVGSDTNIAAISNAIGQYESGGNYQALGPVVPSGMYKGEQALGKYQIMPGNLPSWSKQALGYVVTPQQFLASPQIQDAIAQHKMGEIFKKYGNPADVASVWFSGQPLAKNTGAKDVLGTTVPQYVKNVLSYLG